MLIAKVDKMLKKNKLKSFRENKVLSQEKLAALAGVTRQTVISIETGKYVPSLELALRLARIFKCRVDELFDI
jgi:putative transcriptional regulator